MLFRSLSTLIHAEWTYCFITEVELLGKPGIKADEQRIVRQVLSVAAKAAHTQAINEVAISLKQKQSIKTPDTLIAATALMHGLPLLTADKGFTKIKSLDIVLIEN
mgnify:CR=1 FL=1